MDAMNIAATPSWRRSECISKPLNENTSSPAKGYERPPNMTPVVRLPPRLRVCPLYFEVYVVATEFRRRMFATAAPHFSGVFS